MRIVSGLIEQLSTSILTTIFKGGKTAPSQGAKIIDVTLFELAPSPQKGIQVTQNEKLRIHAREQILYMCNKT